MYIYICIYNRSIPLCASPLHCPMLSSLAMMEKVERSGERSMAKIFFMNIMNIVLLMDLQLQPPPLGSSWPCTFCTAPSCPPLPWAASTAGEDAGRPRHDRDGQQSDGSWNQQYGELLTMQVIQMRCAQTGHEALVQGSGYILEKGLGEVVGGPFGVEGLVTLRSLEIFCSMSNLFVG